MDTGKFSNNEENLIRIRNICNKDKIVISIHDLQYKLEDIYNENQNSGEREQFLNELMNELFHQIKSECTK